MQEKQPALKRNLSFIYVFAIATGAIFTMIAYWDTVFISNCGPATFLAFILMMAAVLPVAFVYSELAPMFPQVGGELVYNTVGCNKHLGFFAAWAMLMSGFANAPAAVMAILEWFSLKVYTFFTGHESNWSIRTISIVGIILIFIYLMLSLHDINVAGKVQLAMTGIAIVGSLVTTVAIFLSGHWSVENFKPFFQSTVGDGGIGGWAVGLALIITPFFGFETVPQMMEEGNFPPEKASKAIWGSVVTCGIVYALYFLAVSGLGGFEELLYLGGDPANGEVKFLTISAMQNLLGWTVWPMIFGVAGILCAIGSSLLGFWLATVRMLYGMGRQNYLPKAFGKLNKHNQPLWANIFLFATSAVLLLLQNETTFMKDFFNLMGFSVAIAYSCTCYSNIRIHRRHPEWKSGYHIPGGWFMRYLAFLIAICIAIGCCLGQSAGSWLSFGVYAGLGVILWLYMLKKWKTEHVEWNTPDGPMQF